MNRKNSGAALAVPFKVKANPGDSLRWSKVNSDDFSAGLTRPGYPGDAGFDLAASRPVTVAAGGFARVPTNVKVAPPAGRWTMLVGRSSTFFKRQLIVQTAIIDNGFRGELWFVVFNLGDQPVVIKKKDRLAQLIVFDLITPEVREVTTEDLPPGDRGEKGFGSSGGLGED